MICFKIKNPESLRKIIVDNKLNLSESNYKNTGNKYFSIFLSGCKRFKSLHKNLRGKDNTFLKQNNYLHCFNFIFIFIFNK